MLTRALVLLLVAVLCAGCSITPEEPKLPDGMSLPPIVITKPENKEDQDQLHTQTTKLLRAQQYEELQTLADELRKSKARYANGFWKLDLYYLALGDLPKEAGESEWETRLKQLNEWTAKSDTVTPRAALTDALATYAWKARGTGYASTITPEGAQLMTERLNQAKKIFETASTHPVNCPRFYSSAQRIALGLGWSESDYNKLVDAAVRLEPTYRTSYFYKGTYLLPRWYGKRGDWEKFAAETADQIGGDEGDKFYAQMIGYMNQFHSNIFKESTISWTRARKGFELLLKEYPDSLWLNSRYALLCFLNGEQNRTRSLLDKIGGRCDIDVWRTEDYFQKVRARTYAH